jgi:transmembrane sensor
MSARPSDDLRAIERAAAEWSLRAQSGLPAGEQREFEAWLRQDPRHAAIFAEMDETSKLLDQLRDPALARPGTGPFEAPFTPTSPSARPRPRWLVPVGLAAAALVAMAAIGGAVGMTRGKISSRRSPRKSAHRAR